MFGLGRYDEGQLAKQACSTLAAAPRTLTEQLDDQIAYHQGKIDLLKDAKAAMTPEVERALNALQKLS